MTLTAETIGLALTVTLIGATAVSVTGGGGGAGSLMPIVLGAQRFLSYGTGLAANVSDVHSLVAGSMDWVYGRVGLSKLLLGGWRRGEVEVEVEVGEGEPGRRRMQLVMALPQLVENLDEEQLDVLDTWAAVLKGKLQSARKRLREGAPQAAPAAAVKWDCAR